MPRRIDHDRLFKELLTTFFWEFIELFLPEIAAYLDQSSISFIDKEIFTDITAGDRYETDLLIKGKVRKQDSFFLIHLEHQAQHQAEFSKRMFRYFARLYEKYDLPIYPIALFSFTSPKTPQSNSHSVIFSDQTILQFNYKLIQLNQLNWRDFLQQSNPVAIALMSRMNIVKADRLRVKSECLRLLATLRIDRARMKLISGFVDTYLRLSAEENQILRNEIDRIEPEQREVIMEILTSWMEEGLQQGLRQGLQQGKQELILRQLSRRFGEIGPSVQEQIRGLSADQLDRLGEELLSFSTQADLVNWLE